MNLFKIHKIQYKDVLYLGEEIKKRGIAASGVPLAIMILFTAGCGVVADNIRSARYHQLGQAVASQNVSQTIEYMDSYFDICHGPRDEPAFRGATITSGNCFPYLAMFSLRFYQLQNYDGVIAIWTHFAEKYPEAFHDPRGFAAILVAALVQKGELRRAEEVAAQSLAWVRPPREIDTRWRVGDPITFNFASIYANVNGDWSGLSPDLAAQLNGLVRARRGSSQVLTDYGRFREVYNSSLRNERDAEGYSARAAAASAAVNLLRQRGLEHFVPQYERQRQIILAEAGTADRVEATQRRVESVLGIITGVAAGAAVGYVASNAADRAQRQQQAAAPVPAARLPGLPQPDHRTTGTDQPYRTIAPRTGTAVAGQAQPRPPGRTDVNAPRMGIDGMPSQAPAPNVQRFRHWRGQSGTTVHVANEGSVALRCQVILQYIQTQYDRSQTGSENVTLFIGAGATQFATYPQSTSGIGGWAIRPGSYTVQCDRS